MTSEAKTNEQKKNRQFIGKMDYSKEKKKIERVENEHNVIVQSLT